MAKRPRKLNNGGGIGRLTSGPVGPSAKHDLFIIDDETINDPRIRDTVFVPTVNGEAKGHGLVPRDYNKYPAQMFAPPSEMPIFSDDEIKARIEEAERQKATLKHLCTWTPKDQNGHGYCWAYSVVGAVEFLRAVMNQPLVRLSAHAVAAIIKKGRDEGGWCGLSAKFVREVGVPSDAFWKTHSRDTSQDTPALRANAALHKVTEDWVDLTRDVYDQNLTMKQVDSSGVLNIPRAEDHNWWSHSVFGGPPTLVEANSLGHWIRNSWGNWGDNGWAILRGSKRIVDGAVALRVTGASNL